MNGAEQRVIDQAVSLHKAGKFTDAAHLYNMVLNRHPMNVGILSLMADLFNRIDYTGLAINLYGVCIQADPENGKYWNDLGIAFRKENMLDEAKNAYAKSIELQGETAENCNNMAGLYSDSCEPEKALDWADRALKHADLADAHWHRALALLTQKRWAEGWDEYEYRQKLESWDSRRTIAAPTWDFNQTEHLYVHGEQGVGDEVMFLSCLDEAIRRARHVTVEVHPAVAQLVRQTWPDVSVVTEEAKGDYTAKIALASLAVHFRRSEDAFPGVPYLKPDPALVEHYRARLSAVGPRPWVALTWLGGAKRTRTEERSLDLASLRPIMDQFSCVSAQYEHVQPFVKVERERNKLIALDDLCVGKDLAHQAALFEAVDAVVTVQQTAVHVAGAVGAKTFALINERPHWRYGMQGNLPWYRSVSLYRKTSDWGSLIEKVRSDIADQFGVSGTQRAVA